MWVSKFSRAPGTCCPTPSGLRRCRIVRKREIIMFPGELKKMFAQITRAEKEGLAALERARGETAALRNLANAAKMLDDNPNLLQLRMLQSLSETSGNTIIMNLGVGSQIIPLKGQKEISDNGENKNEPKDFA